MLRKERKWYHVKCSVITTNRRKNVKYKNRNNKSNKQKTVTNPGNINLTMSMITLNGNGLNTQRLSEWIKKQASTKCCLQETHFKYKDTYRLKVKGWRKIYHDTTNKRKQEQSY